MKYSSTPYAGMARGGREMAAACNVYKVMFRLCSTDVLHHVKVIWPLLLLPPRDVLLSGHCWACFQDKRPLLN